MSDYKFAVTEKDFNHLVMEAVYTSIILTILCTSVVCAIGLQTAKTTGGKSGGKSKTKVPQSLSKETKCGISATAANGGRIVGGEEAKPHSWPWQVWIECKFVQRDDMNGTSCGGSIISDKYIITAAHCLYLAKIDSRSSCKVLLGKHDLQRKESTQLIAKIADCLIHEKYDDDNLGNGFDLALCKLAKPVKFTDAIQPICLPFGLPELPYEKSCYATGWGITKPDSKKPSDTLMQLSMTVTRETQCPVPIDRVICTARWDGGKDVCQGDSGGPLACQEQDRRWYLRGVLSGGPKECNLWAAFTKVAFYEKWIKNVTSRN